MQTGSPHPAAGRCPPPSAPQYLLTSHRKSNPTHVVQQLVGAAHYLQPCSIRQPPQLLKRLLHAVPVLAALLLQLQKGRSKAPEEAKATRRSWQARWPRCRLSSKRSGRHAKRSGRHAGAVVRQLRRQQGKQTQALHPPAPPPGSTAPFLHQNKSPSQSHRCCQTMTAMWSWDERRRCASAPAAAGLGQQAADDAQPVEQLVGCNTISTNIPHLANAQAGRQALHIAPPVAVCRRRCRWRAVQPRRVGSVVPALPAVGAVLPGARQQLGSARAAASEWGSGCRPSHAAACRLAAPQRRRDAAGHLRRPQAVAWGL